MVAAERVARIQDEKLDVRPDLVEAVGSQAVGEPAADKNDVVKLLQKGFLPTMDRRRTSY